MKTFIFFVESNNARSLWQMLPISLLSGIALKYFQGNQHGQEFLLPSEKESTLRGKS